MVRAALDQFRLLVVDRPILLALLVAACAALWLRSDPVYRRTAAWLGRSGPRWLAAAAALALAYYAGVVLWYVLIDDFLDFAEPSIPAVAWVFRQGGPLYHDPDSAARYSLVYGPMLYAIHALALDMFGPSVIASKLVGGAAALGSIGCTYVLLRSVSTGRLALILTGVEAATLLMFRNFSFWTRPEPLLLLGVSAGLLAARSSSRLAAVGVAALAAGVCVNLKISGVLYVLPVLAVLQMRHGAAALAIAAAGAAAVAALPFGLPTVSLRNYLVWLDYSGRNGLRLWSLRFNVEWAAFLMLPAAAWPYLEDRRWLRTQAPLLASLAIAIAGVALIAAKPGAGFYHLMPFAPVVLYFSASLIARLPAEDLRSREAIALGAGFAFALVPVAAYQQYDFIRTVVPGTAAEIRADLRDTTAEFPDRTLAVGYGGAFRVSFERVWPVFRGNPYLIDAPAVTEYQLSGLAMPEATYEAIRTCAIDVWLIPRGAAPFDVPNGYFLDAYTPLFDDRFRRTFATSYELTAHTQYFDIWICRAGGAGPA
jgi:hypothetical protein